MRRIDERSPSIRAAVPPRGRPSSNLPLDQRDCILVTYGDTLGGRSEPPLRYLRRFLDERLRGAATGVHILPFCPYTSDDGFSVSDYRAVDAQLGSWDDLTDIARDYLLMADLVLNHCSASHRWFQGFLRGEEPFRRYFITVSPDADTSSVVRPRARPLLTPFETADGVRCVWTTFSPDQIDLNYAEPKLLLEMIDILLFYLSRGVRIIRLDAVAYLWKEIGTACIHLPQTHMVVQLFRAILDATVPEAMLITETNVPHEENISYFGNGENESHMVYNFPLPPLTLHSFISGSAEKLTEWVAGLQTPNPDVTWFNFLASHDGIGLTPAHGILTPEEIEQLVECVCDRGGRVSYKATPNGDVPYELNISYLSAIVEPGATDSERTDAFVSAHAIMLALAGLPALYIHSVLGSTNWLEGVKETGENRTINRPKLDWEQVSSELDDSGSLRAAVYTRLYRLIRVRADEAAFHPAAAQRVLRGDAPSVFALLRGEAGGAGPRGASSGTASRGARGVAPGGDRAAAPDAGRGRSGATPGAAAGGGAADSATTVSERPVLCLQNVAAYRVHWRPIDSAGREALERIGAHATGGTEGQSSGRRALDLISGKSIEIHDGVELPAYGVLWLVAG